MENTLRFRLRLIGSDNTGEKALLLILEGLGVAMCFTQRQADTLAEQFSEITEPEARQRLQTLISKAAEENGLPPQRRGCTPRLIQKGFAGSFLADALISFIDQKEQQVRPVVDLTIDPKKFN